MTHIDQYNTTGGVTVVRSVEAVPVAGAVDGLVDVLNSHRGVLLASTYEYPGRYTRWDIGFSDPPLEIVARQRLVTIRAMNERGQLLVRAIEPRMRVVDAVESVQARAGELIMSIAPAPLRFAEEERSRQPSIFSVLRAVIETFASGEDAYLGLYGAFGYDLAFQFEPIRLNLTRPDDQRDLVVYLPDRILVVDHQREHAELRSYDFEVDGQSTSEFPRVTGAVEYSGSGQPDRACDHEPGMYSSLVETAREAFKRGDLFEAVPGQTFFEPTPDPPSVLFQRLRSRNPSPYGFLMNLGEREYLVGASPEMYVRVEGDRVETCPISGTIARGEDPIADAARVLTLLNSKKDEAELTMCTDVDRNDKSRICVPGSVRVIGRRQIEMYSRVIHTVDHVEGRLRPGFDALDAFLAHAWAVTVTGAPKARAMQFLEDHERSPRAWYGGAVGAAGFDGNLNTGLTLRTIRVKDGVAEVRAGATLLFDSDPEEEERETRIKASALMDAILQPERQRHTANSHAATGSGKRILLIDHQDSFVHTLANYFRQTGADVVTMRYGLNREEIRARRPDLLVLSPGPGRPSDFDVHGTLQSAIELQVPVFGVCLGLQGVVEYFGGALGVLDTPVHGKSSVVCPEGSRLFEGIGDRLTVGRYHSLYAIPESLPALLRITSRSEDGVIMSVEHERLPIAAVQFHPESIMTLDGDAGMRLIRNVVTSLAHAPSPQTVT